MEMDITNFRQWAPGVRQEVIAEKKWDTRARAILFMRRAIYRHVRLSGLTFYEDEIEQVGNSYIFTLRQEGDRERKAARFEKLNELEAFFKKAKFPDRPFWVDRHWILHEDPKETVRFLIGEVRNPETHENLVIDYMRKLNSLRRICLEGPYQPEAK